MHGLFTVHNPVCRVVDMQQAKVEITAEEPEVLSHAEDGLAVLEVLPNGHINLPTAIIDNHRSLLGNFFEADAPAAAAAACTG